MFGIADYAAFVAAIVIFLLIPGPGNLALITSTSKGGVRGGIAATLGVIAGDQVLMWMAVAGVAALLTAWPPAFRALQWLGAIYLAWLGTKMLLAKPGDAPVLNIQQRLPEVVARLDVQHWRIAGFGQQHLRPQPREVDGTEPLHGAKRGRPGGQQGGHASDRHPHQNLVAGD